MANSLNKCQFIGNLAADPETSAMPSGEAVTKIRIGCNWKSKNSEGVEWIPIVFFGKLAEIVADHARKGTQVYVEGRWKTRVYEPQGGDKRYFTECIGQNMQLLGSRGESGQGSSQPPADHRGHTGSNQDNPTYGQDQSAPAGGFDSFDDDIPFQRITGTLAMVI